MSNEYKIDSLVDIIALDDDQIDRLCAELPSVLKQVKAIKTLVDAIGDMEGIDDAMKILTPLTWIDDGECNVTMTGTCADGEVFRFETTASEPEH